MAMKVAMAIAYSLSSQKSKEKRKDYRHVSEPQRTPCAYMLSWVHPLVHTKHVN